ncbi:class I SAM-dependent methyltransferase [Hwanghaeella sp.]|uniref:class I SAM-dependent methyltransferase n=1 Tax=Hwanghaeella sp. TaxID=2605943 RepID=UPI003CCB913D
MIFTASNSTTVLEKDEAVLTELVRQLLQRYPDEFLQIPFIRSALATMKIDALDKNALTLGQVENPAALVENAISHNIDGMIGKVSLFRPSILVMPLRSLDRVAETMKVSRVLSVGPRTEAEIYTLIACGFEPSNIRGLDLFSYSDFVDAGDMHAMPYDDDSFDIVILGWVLAYSNDQKKAAAEVLRVLRPGGIVAIGYEYTALSSEELRDQGSDVADAPQMKTTNQILELFAPHVEDVYFRHDIHASRKDKSGSLMTIFSTPQAPGA